MTTTKDKLIQLIGRFDRETNYRYEEELSDIIDRLEAMPDKSDEQ